MLFEQDSRPRLVVDGSEILVAESYEITASILTQPAAFSIRLGHGGVARELLQRFHPGLPFQLYIGDTLQQTGRLEDPGAEGGTGATEVTLKGRDLLSLLHDDEFNADTAFQDQTYDSLVESQILAVGLDATLFTTNDANRRILTGEKQPKVAAPVVIAAPIGDTGEKNIPHQTIQARLGERRYAFLRRYLDMAGLFLWCACDGSFVLSAPNGNQPPIARICRRRGETRNVVNVLRASYSNGSSHRHQLYEVYGRTGGRKGGRAKIKGVFTDEEMKAWGIVKTRAIRSKSARTVEQAVSIARRKCAEERRQDWRLTYTMAGHKTPSFRGGVITWAPDIVVDVQDDEYGIFGPHYVETVTFRVNPQAETELQLMRIEDLVFVDTAGNED